MMRDQTPREHSTARNMVDPSTKHSARSANTVQELLFVLMVSPIMLLLGFHIAGLALMARRYLRIPYVVSVAVSMAGVSSPLLFLRDHNAPIWIPVAAMIFIQALVLGAHALFYDKQELLDGGNVEYIAPAHMMLCLMFLILPGFYAAREEALRRNATVHNQCNVETIVAGRSRTTGCRQPARGPSIDDVAIARHHRRDRRQSPGTHPPYRYRQA